MFGKTASWRRPRVGALHQVNQTVMIDENQQRSNDDKSDGRQSQASRAKMRIRDLPKPAPKPKSDDDPNQKMQFPTFNLPMAYPMSYHHADVCNNASDVTGADHQATIAARHRVLQTASHRDRRQRESMLMQEQPRGRAKQASFNNHGHTITTTWNQLPGTDEHSHQHGTGDESGDDARCGDCVNPARLGNIHSQMRNGPGHMTDRRTKESERNRVHKPRGGRQSQGARQKQANLLESIMLLDRLWM